MNKFCFMLLFCSFFVIACEKDEVTEREDIEKPSVKLSGLEETEFLVGEVHARAEVEDDGEIDKVEVYLDETLLKGFFEAPYEFSLDTEQFADGEHELRVVAFDKAGKQAETREKVRISNVLLTVDLSLILQGPPPSDEEGAIYYVVSTKEGKVVTYEQFSFNGTEPFKTVVKSPQGFYGEEFIYTVISWDKDYKEVVLLSYVVKRGQDWQFTERSGSHRELVDYFFVNCLNQQEDDRIEILGTDNSSSFQPRSEEPRHKVNVYQGSSEVDYFIFQQKEGHLGAFDALPELASDKENWVDLDTLKQNFSTHSLSVTEAQDLEIMGEVDFTGRAEFFLPIGQLNTAGSANYCFPNGLPAEDYQLSINYSRKNLIFKNVITSNSAALSYKELEARASLADVSEKGASLSFSNQQFDYYTMVWESLSSSEEDLVWYFNFPPDITEIKLFSIAEVVKGFQPEWQQQLSYSSIGIVDFDDIKGYDAAHEWFMLEPFGYPDVRASEGEEYRYILQWPEGEGSRRGLKKRKQLIF